MPILRGARYENMRGSTDIGPDVYIPKFPARPIRFTVVDEMCSRLAS